MFVVSADTRKTGVSQRLTADVVIPPRAIFFIVKKVVSFVLVNVRISVLVGSACEWGRVQCFSVRSEFDSEDGGRRIVRTPRSDKTLGPFSDVYTHIENKPVKPGPDLGTATGPSWNLSTSGATVR